VRNYGARDFYQQHFSAGFPGDKDHWDRFGVFFSRTGVSMPFNSGIRKSASATALRQF
jgi:hypothetical protein